MRDKRRTSRPYQEMLDIPFVSYCQPLEDHLPQLGHYQCLQRNLRQTLLHPVKYVRHRE